MILSLSNILLHDIELPLWKKGIITLNVGSYGTVANLTAYNINIDVNSRSTLSDSYLSTRAAILNFDSIEDEDEGEVLYTVDTVTAYNTYSQYGTAIAMEPFESQSISVLTSIQFMNLDISQCGVMTNGVFYVNGNYAVTLTNSIFENNIVSNNTSTSTKDLYIGTFNTFAATFVQFLGNADISGSVQSIVVNRAGDSIPTFTNITFKCNPDGSSGFNETQYIAILKNGGFDEVKSPFVVYESKIRLATSVFANWRNSERGGVIGLYYR